MARQELEVQALWHEQVHKARVSALAFSAGGETLWTACDAAAPRLGSAEGHSSEPPVAEVSCKDGSTLRRSSDLPPCNVRLLRPLPQEGMLLCVTGDGGFVTLAVGSGNQGAAVRSTTALPGTPAGTAVAMAGGDSSQRCSEAEDGGAGLQPAMGPGTPESAPEGSAEGEAGSTGSTGSSGDPEFVAEAGYRGHREGYLFREGAKGVGYYRKDVVRQYCPSAAAVQPAAAVPAAHGTAAMAVAAAPEAAAQLEPGPASGNGLADGVAGASGHAGQAADQLEAEETRRYIQRLLRAPPSMHSVVFSPCGMLLFTSSLGPKDCSARVWGLLPCSPSSGGSAGVQPELHRTLAGHTAPVLSLAVTPDARLLLTGSYDQTIRVWSTADWHCMRVLKGHGGGVRALAVAPDGQTLYSAAADNTIRAWSMQHWVCLRTMHGRHDDTTWPACLALSPNGSLLASGSTGPFGASTIKVFQTATDGGREAGSCLASFAQLRYNQKAGMTALLFSPDGSTLYSGASDGTVAAWRLSWRSAAATTGSKGGGLRRGFL